MRILLAVNGLALVLVACTSLTTPAPQEQPSPPDPTRVETPQGPDFDTPEPTPLPPPTPTPFPTAQPDDPDWDDPAQGVERRDVTVLEPRSGAYVRLHMVRLDPGLIDFRVLYDRGKVGTVTSWQAETGALLVVNGGFFDAQLTKQGLTLVNGQAYGSLRDYTESVGVGGLFAVKDSRVSIVALDRKPASPDKYDFDFATEAYPMLLTEGGEPAFDQETGHTAKRTVVAMDRSGRVVFIIIQEDAFTLYELGQALAELEELDLDVALNLDGGTSSGMVVKAGSTFEPFYSETALPIVITAYPKDVAE